MKSEFFDFDDLSNLVGAGGSREQSSSNPLAIPKQNFG